MAKVLGLGEARKRFEKLREQGDLNFLLKEAKLICHKNLKESKGEISLSNRAEFKEILQRNLYGEIIRRRLIQGGVFLCSIYATNLLMELISSTPESWWAIDYAGQDDVGVLKRGGDVCFIICGVFPKRTAVRLMDLPYYEKMGIQFYYRLYCRTKKDIGYHMSAQFPVMAEVVQAGLANFRKEM